jgi:maltose alpha-D-glucosyltransferase/alpha-amylase
MNLDLDRLRDSLGQARWFGEKDRSIQSVEIFDAGRLDDAEEALVLVLLNIGFADGGSAIYHLPLLVRADGSARDAADDPQRLALIGELLTHGHPIKGERGVFHFSGPGLDPLNPPGRSVWKIGAEQSNTSVVFDDEVILKFFRKIEAGPNPDLELLRVLTNEGFRSIPSQLGEIFYEETPEEESTSPDQREATVFDLGIAQRFITGGREGWDFTLEQLGGLLDQIHEADTPEDRVLLIEERASDLLATIEQLGETTASLHVTLAREDIEDEFRPEPVEEDDLVRWSEGAQIRLRRLATEEPELAALAPAVARRLSAAVGLPEAGAKTRIHGDYHLGQVLRVPRLWYILDFEGEPARSLEERRAKQSPLKDVAGMLRSLSYAAFATLFGRTEPDGEEWQRLEPWLLTWEELARERFLNTYLAKAHEGRFLPVEPEVTATLLDLFELDKAIYEIGYERGSRPDWVRIPLRGISRAIERSEVR